MGPGLSRGRRAHPAGRLTLALIGLDLGGTKIFGARIEGTEVVGTAKRKTPTEGGPDAVIDRLLAVADDLGGTSDIDGLGVGAPGPVAAGGVVMTAPNLPGWDRPVPLAALLSDRAGVAVAVENDVAASTWAEATVGAAVGARDVLGVWMGTGVGGGVVSGGRLVRGARGAAAEIGHLSVRPRDDRPCGCGASGHLEAYAGRAGMAVEARRRHDAGQATTLFEIAAGKRLTSRVWAEALKAGDELATQLLEEATDAMADALAAAAAMVDPEVVVLGGGLAERLGHAWLDDLARRMATRCFAPPPGVERARLGDPAGALGAALLSLDG